MPRSRASSESSPIGSIDAVRVATAPSRRRAPSARRSRGRVAATSARMSGPTGTRTASTPRQCAALSKAAWAGLGQHHLRARRRPARSRCALTASMIDSVPPRGDDAADLVGGARRRRAGRRSWRRSRPRAWSRSATGRRAAGCLGVQRVGLREEGDVLRVAVVDGAGRVARPPSAGARARPSPRGRRAPRPAARPVRGQPLERLGACRGRGAAPRRSPASGSVGHGLVSWSVAYRGERGRRDRAARRL